MSVYFLGGRSGGTGGCSLRSETRRWKKGNARGGKQAQAQASGERGGWGSPGTRSPCLPGAFSFQVSSGSFCTGAACSSKHAPWVCLRRSHQQIACLALDAVPLPVTPLGSPRVLLSLQGGAGSGLLRAAPPGRPGPGTAACGSSASSCPQGPHALHVASPERRGPCVPVSSPYSHRHSQDTPSTPSV